MKYEEIRQLGSGTSRPRETKPPRLPGAAGYELDLPPYPGCQWQIHPGRINGWNCNRITVRALPFLLRICVKHNLLGSSQLQPGGIQVSCRLGWQVSQRKRLGASSKPYKTSANRTHTLIRNTAVEHSQKFKMFFCSLSPHQLDIKLQVPSRRDMMRL